MKLYCPGLCCYLVESRRKRAAFLSTVRRELGLKDVSVIGQPLERCRPLDFDPPPRLLTLRAVGLSETLLSQGLSLLGPHGTVLLFTTEGGLKRGFPAGPSIRWDAPVRIPWSREKVLLLGRAGESSEKVSRET
jgi:hypothetical protein